MLILIFGNTDFSHQVIPFYSDLTSAAPVKAVIPLRANDPIRIIFPVLVGLLLFQGFVSLVVSPDPIAMLFWRSIIAYMS